MPTPEPLPDAPMSAGDVAKLAGVSPETVRAWENNGKLAAERSAGGMRLFRRKDVEAFLANREVDRAEKETNR